MKDSIQKSAATAKVARSRERQRVEPEQFTKEPKHGRFWMSCGISTVLFGAAIYVLLSGVYSDSTERWAILALGNVTGAWLSRYSS